MKKYFYCIILILLPFKTFTQNTESCNDSIYYYNFNINYDVNKYFQDKGSSVNPLSPFVIDKINLKDNYLLVKTELSKQKKEILIEPQGIIQYPYLIPGGSYTSIWDWDSYFITYSLDKNELKYGEGCLLFYLSNIKQDGTPPSSGSIDKVSYSSMALPLFAQWAYFISVNKNDFNWLSKWWDTLLLNRKWYENTCQSRRGLFRIANWRGIGFDNDPVTYGKAKNTIAAVHVNCMHYREYLALAAIAKRLNKINECDTLLSKACKLKKAINQYMWDPIDGMYYHVYLGDLEKGINPQRQEITWELPIKIRTVACLWPLWAGIATKEQADIIIKKHVLDTTEFLSKYGIRSLAKIERMYNNTPMGGPSNWQGPVWGISTFMVCYGLNNYGYNAEALDIANRIIALFAGDLKQNKKIHEFYHSETGVPLLKPGFLSWNLIAIRLIDDLTNNIDPAEIK